VGAAFFVIGLAEEDGRLARDAKAAKLEEEIVVESLCVGIHDGLPRCRC
jgi:hypothetical protein